MHPDAKDDAPPGQAVCGLLDLQSSRSSRFSPGCMATAGSLFFSGSGPLAYGLKAYGRFSASPDERELTVVAPNQQREAAKHACVGAAPRAEKFLRSFPCGFRGASQQKEPAPGTGGLEWLKHSRSIRPSAPLSPSKPAWQSRT